MATMIYNCKRCKLGRRVEYPIRIRTIRGCSSYYREEGGKRITAGVWIERGGGGLPTVYGGDPLGLCPGCGRKMEYSFLVATTRLGVPCDARCTGARGHSCDCSCGGKNHGAGWSVQLGAPLLDVIKRAEKSTAVAS
jgi:hypothetical protein